MKSSQPSKKNVGILRKSKLFLPKRAKKELDTLWSKLIRNRDGVCRKCKKAPASQAAHIFGRGNLSTRWDKENGFGMCYYCHIIWAHRNPVEFTIWAMDELGAEKFKALKAKSRVVFDASELRAVHRDKLEELKIAL